MHEPTGQRTQVSVVGTGTIGASWAACFLAAGLDVVATDPVAGAERRLREEVARLWPDLERVGVRPGASPDRLCFEPELAAAVAGSWLVQECAPEREALKVDLFAALDRFAEPDALLASSSSGLLASRIPARCARPERCLVAHPFNPPHLMALVEVVGGSRTSPASIEAAVAFYASIGKRPIVLRREVAGHVANRLQAAVFREAIHLVTTGVASVADVDAAVVAGLGPRWALMGPFLTFHLAGGDGGIAHFLAHLADAYNAWFADLGTPVLDEASERAIVAGLGDEVGAATVGELAAARDAFLLALRELTVAG